MEIKDLFKKNMISFRFSYNVSDGLNFETEDASSYFEKAIRPNAEKPVCFNGASYSTDIIYDLKKILNTSSLCGEHITSHGFCSFENIELCKKQFTSEVTVLVHERIKELEEIKDKHLSQLKSMLPLELNNFEIFEKLATMEDLDFSVEDYGVFVSEFIPNFNNSESHQYDPINDKALWNELIVKYKVIVSHDLHTVSINRNGMHERSFTSELTMIRNALMVIIDSEVMKLT
jgi:hypothetical protein